MASYLAPYDEHQAHSVPPFCLLPFISAVASPVSPGLQSERNSGYQSKCASSMCSAWSSSDSNIVVNAAPRGVKNVLYYPSEFEVAVERVAQPQDDDRPLPRRTLARISHSSAASGLPGSELGVAGDSSGTMLGITHAQLMKLQLADIANMLLPDRTNSIHSQSGGLPFVTVRSEGSASVIQDAPSDTTQTTFGMNDIYHDAISAKDFSGPLDNMSSPSPVARRGLHSRNSLSHGEDGSPFHPPQLAGRDPNRHVWSPMQPQSSPSLPSTPSASRKKGGKTLRSTSNHAVDPSSSRFAAAVDIVQGHNDTRVSVFNQEVDHMEPVDIEL